MRQALHIFRKDIRSLWWEIAVVIAVEIGYAYAKSAFQISRPLDWLLPLACVYLVVRVILEEPLPGDRQFWITRPYAWQSLLGAKALFVIALVNLPLLIADCVILARHGFSPAAHAGGLLWRQAELTAVILLPAAALAAIARNPGQILLALFATAAGLALGVYWLTDKDTWGPMEWIRYVPVAALWLAAALLVVLWQYSSRRTAPSRSILACAVALTPAVYAAMSWAVAFDLHSRMLAQAASPLRIRPAPGRPMLLGRSTEKRVARASVPILITGLDPDQDFQTDALHVELQSQGETWQYGWADTMSISQGPGENFWADIYVSGPWRAAKRQHVRLRLALALTVFARNEPIRVHPESSWFPVPNFGSCEFRDDAFSVGAIQCIAPLRPPPRTLVYGEGPVASSYRERLRPSIHLASYAPYPAEFRLDPIVKILYERRTPSRKFVFITERPVAHVIRELEIADVSLAE